MIVADEPAYRITIDPVARRLDYRLMGHWDVATVARFEAGMGDAVAQLPCVGIRPGEQVALFDATGFTVQSPDVVAAMGRMAATMHVTARRVAVVLTSALLRMQAKRAMPQLGLFDDRATALAWLHGDDAPPA